MKVQIPFAGHASGTTGNLIFQTYWGKTFARSKPVLYHYPDTEAQQKAQALFYAIQRVWLPIFHALKRVFPRVTPKGQNLFNVLSSGVYKAAKTYPRERSKPLLQRFGTDVARHVLVTVKQAELQFTGKTILLKYTGLRSHSDIDFRPIHANILAVNITQQSLMLYVGFYSNGTVNVEFSNVQNWLATDKITIYVNLTSKNYASDFFLIAEN